MASTTMHPCHECGVQGKSVSLRTLEHLLRHSALERIDRSAEYRFCRTPGCSTVYYNDSEQGSFSLAEVLVRVGQKQPGPPTPVCYCFDFTVEQVAAEVESSGESTIPDQITTRIQSGECACEIRNPQGSCCLGNVRAAVRDTKERLIK